jgi:hypothetical protein
MEAWRDSRKGERKQAVAKPASAIKPNAPERLSHEELIKRLEERGLPTSIFGIDKPGPLSIEQ